MPAILESVVQKLIAKGVPKSNAFAIATAGLQKAGDLKKGTQQLTQKGLVRQNMGSAGRARTRG